MSIDPHATVALSVLKSADGSATYSSCGFTITAVVNGPIEPQRRDEIPDQVFLEVNVRPQSGGGSPRDRHLETLVHKTLSNVIDKRSYPRMMLQLTFQIQRTPESDFTSEPPTQSQSVLRILPHLLNVGLFSLLDANINMENVFWASAVVRSPAAEKLRIDDKSITGNMFVDEIHVFAFTGKQKLLLMQTEGPGATMDDIEEAHALAVAACYGEKGSLQWVRQEIVRHVDVRSWWRA